MVRRHCKLDARVQRGVSASQDGYVQGILLATKLGKPDGKKRRFISPNIEIFVPISLVEIYYLISGASAVLATLVFFYSFIYFMFLVRDPNVFVEALYALFHPIAAVVVYQVLIFGVGTSQSIDGNSITSNGVLTFRGIALIYVAMAPASAILFCAHRIIMKLKGE